MLSVTSMWQPGLSNGDDARVEALWQSHAEVDDWHLADDDWQLDSLSAAHSVVPLRTRQRTLSRVAQRSALRNTFALRKPRRIRTPSGQERQRRIVVCRSARLCLKGKPKAALQQPCNRPSPRETRVRPQRVKEAQPAVPVASKASIAAPRVPPPAARSRLCLRGRNKEEALTRRRHWTHTGLDPPARCAAEAEREEAKPPYGYTGHRFESELGLTDAGGRFYDAKFGIFLSPDPIGPLNGGSTFGNRYSYTGYDPINFVDPTGFQADDGVCSVQAPSPDGTPYIHCVPVPADELVPPPELPSGPSDPNEFGDCEFYDCTLPANEGIPNAPGNKGNASKGKPHIFTTSDGQMFGTTAPTDLSSEGLYASISGASPGAAAPAWLNDMMVPNAFEKSLINQFVDFFNFRFMSPDGPPGGGVPVPFPEAPLTNPFLTGLVYMFPLALEASVVPGAIRAATFLDDVARGGAFRGINRFGGVVSSSENAAGGVVVTAEGSVQGVDFAGHVNAGLMRGGRVNILSGVHGTEAGVMTADAAILGEDVAMFGRIQGVVVHNTAGLSAAEISGMLNGPGTTIGAFCNSGVCLAPFIW